MRATGFLLLLYGLLLTLAQLDLPVWRWVQEVIRLIW